MRKWAAYALGAATVVGSAVTAHAKLLPTESARMQTIDIGGKRSAYFRMDRGVDETVHVQGPTRLKCIVRITPDTLGTPVTYAIAVFDAGKRIRLFRTETEASNLVWNESGEPVAQSQSFILNVPAGAYKYRFRLIGRHAPSAGLRCLDKGFRAAGTQVVVLPVEVSEPITLIVKEKPLEYAISRADAPVTLKLVGPTRLRVVSRLVYGDRMKGRQPYTVRIDRDGRSVPDKELTTEKSLLAECREQLEWNFGRSRTFFVDIPAGVHRVTLRPSNNDSPGVALRFTIPREDIANENR